MFHKMQTKIQTLGLFIIILILLDTSSISAGPMNQISKCQASFKNTSPIQFLDNMDYLRMLLPKDSKGQKKITDYQNINEQDIPEINDYRNIAFYKILREVLSKENIDFLKQALIAHPKLLKLKTKEGQKNLLHLAILQGNLSTVRFLAQFKELINSKDATGATPLLLSMIGGAKHFDIFSFLLSHPDTDITVKDIFGDNIFHYIFFIKEDSQRHNKKTALNTLFEYLDFQTMTHLINSANDKGESPFSYLIRDFNIEIARIILNKTAINFSQVTTEGNNFLHIASAIPNTKAIKFLLQYTTHTMISQKNHSGLTPIQIIQSHYPALSEIDIKENIFNSDFVFKNLFMSYNEAQQLMKEQGIKTAAQFNEWIQDGKKPDRFPPYPQLTYHVKWEGWDQFFSIEPLYYQ